MLNLDNIVSNKKENKNNDWPFRILIIGPSGSGKTNTLLHLINKSDPIDKIYLYPKDIGEEKYKFLINKREQAGLKNLNDSKALWNIQMIWMMCLMILIIIIKIEIKKY